MSTTVISNNTVTVTQEATKTITIVSPGPKGDPGTITTNTGGLIGGALNVQGDITSSGNISSSGNILADIYKSHGTNAIAFSSNTIKVSENYPIILNHSSTTATNITASGNISASGHISSSGLHIRSSTITDFIKLNSLGSSASPIKLIFEKAEAEQGIIEYNRNGDLEIYNTDADGGVMIDGSTSAGGDLYVANSGNVGIGTTTPTSSLHIAKMQSGGGPILTLENTHDSIDVGDLLGSIEFIGNDNQLPSNQRVGAAIKAIPTNTWGAGSLCYGELGFYTRESEAQLYPTEKLRIDKLGNVGIGNTTPTEKLHVSGSISASGKVNIDTTGALFSSKLTVGGDAYTTGGWKVGTSGTYVGKAYNHSGVYSIETATDRNIQFGDAGTPAVMYIHTITENVGIGTAVPEKRLHIHNSGILITGSSAVDSAPLSTRFIVDSGNSIGHTLADFRSHAGSTKIYGSGNVDSTGTGSFVEGIITKNGSFHVEKFGEGLNFFNGTNYTSNRIKLTTAQNLQYLAGGSHQFNAQSVQILNGTPLILENVDNTDSIRLRNNVGSGIGKARLDFTDESNNVKMSISSSGKVGIGTTAPAYPLQIAYNSTTGPAFSIKNINTAVDNNVVMAFNRDNSDTLGWTQGIDSGDNSFKISEDGNNVETNPRITIITGGNIGIGNNTPSKKLEVAGSISASDALFIQKSLGQGTPTIGTSNVGLFQNNTAGQDASIAIIGADNASSRLHFGKHDDIDVGGIRYFHDAHSDASLQDTMRFRIGGANVISFDSVANRGKIVVGGDFTNPQGLFHAQGALSGDGLMLSSSNGTSITVDRGTTGAKGMMQWNTAGTTYWTLGNIQESDNNFYLYSGGASSDKHITLNTTLTTFHTDAVVEGNISASGRVNINVPAALFSSALTVNGDAYTTGGWKVGTGDTFVGKSYNNSGIYSIETATDRKIQFGDAGTPAVMYIDPSTEKIGIGTTAPHLPLHVNGDTRVEGNLLVGSCASTNNPAADIHIKSGGTDAKFRIEDLDADNLAYDFLVNSGSGFTITETTDATSRIHIAQGTGNVGIGTASPTAKLHVSESMIVHASQIDFTDLPTSDPSVAGRLWNSSGTMKISAG